MTASALVAVSRAAFRESKYPTFEVSGSKKHQQCCLWNQNPQEFGTSTLCVMVLGYQVLPLDFGIPREPGVKGSRLPKNAQTRIVRASLLGCVRVGCGLRESLAFSEISVFLLKSPYLGDTGFPTGHDTSI